MVKFCPNCEKLLRKNKDESGEMILMCASCDYREPFSRDFRKKTNNKALERKIVNNKTRVLDETANDLELQPKTNVVCPKCSHDEAFYEQFQTRSADEPATTFYTCTKCKHKWREY